MARPVAGLAARIRHLVPELAKFGIVGGIGTVIDLGGAALLHNAYHVDPLAAKAISLTAATIFTYLGSRFWTFRHRENQPVLREAVLFVTINFVGLVLAEAVIAFTVYGLGLKDDPIAYNAASVLGTALGTIFRFYAYRKWVFLAPAEQQAMAAPANATLDLAEYPPWELDPSWHPDASHLSRRTPGSPPCDLIRSGWTIRLSRTDAWRLPWSPPPPRRARRYARRLRSGSSRPARAPPAATARPANARGVRPARRGR